MSQTKSEVFIAGAESNLLVENPISSWVITGTGNIEILNTGARSAAAGGMGSGGGPEKGPGIKESDTGIQPFDDKTVGSSSDDEAWDPLKPKEEKEKK